MEVCALSRGVMLQPLSARLPASIRLLHLPVPAVPLAHFAVAYPDGSTTGLPCSAQITGWGRSALFAGGVACPRQGKMPALCPPPCRLAQACQHLWLVQGNDEYERSRMLTNAIHPSPLSTVMLVDTVVASRLPPPSDDGRYIVSKLSTGCYHPAVLPRVLLVEQQAPSVSCRHVEQLSPRLHVARTWPCHSLFASAFPRLRQGLSRRRLEPRLHPGGD